MKTVTALLTNKAYGYPTRGARRRRKPTILACLHQTANAKATAIQERNYANRAGSWGPSATAYIDRDGTIVRSIDAGKYAAWSQGDVALPNTKIPTIAAAVASGVNMNEWVHESIECSGVLHSRLWWSGRALESPTSDERSQVLARRWRPVHPRALGAQAMRGLRSGDLLQIPLAEDVFTLGQIIDFPRGDKRVILLVLYPGTFASAEADARLPDILAHSPALEAITFDIQLKEGRWVVVGNQPPPADYAPPVFKVLTPKGFAVIDHHSNFVRDRPSKDVKELRTRTISDGRIIERVARALAGFEPWAKEDDKFRIVGPAGLASGHTFRLPWRRPGTT